MTPMNVSMPVLLDEHSHLHYCDAGLPDGYVERVLKVYAGIACASLLAFASFLLVTLPVAA
ncbi:hypothetical protein NJF44_01260 [Pseudomonas guariconensis]|uniref:hypothetical protein n=1 Tax=Pseudomonas TaxID=286 RepID=UPI002097C3E2|nr:MULTISPECIES: hypothetical protein [Pseudomonas]MCO7513728.1 hypothetical protein [Pseudomonas putida]MCO7603871.1 hypothetical protein [Pseudomonas guariconensis]